MRSKRIAPIILISVFTLTAFAVCGQKPPYYKRVKLVDGRKTVFQGKVYEDYGYNYEFSAKAGQIITVKLTGRDVTFSIHAYDLAPDDQLTPDGKSCSYKLIRNHTGQYAIALKVFESPNYPHPSKYVLEVTLAPPETTGAKPTP